MNKKKLIALIVMSIFLLSIVPMAFAENGRSSGRNRLEVEREDENEVEHETETEIEDSGDDSLDDSRLKAKEKIKLKKIEYLKSREEFVKLKLKVREGKSEAEKTRTKLRSCADVATDDCSNAKGKYNEHISEVVQLVITKLEELKANMQSIESADADVATNAASKVDALIFELNSKLEAVKSAATKEEYKNALMELKDSVKKAQDYIRAFLPQTFNYRLGGVLIKAEQLGARLEKLLQKAKERGKDVTKVTPLVESFKKTLGESKQKFEEAKKLFSQNKLEDAKTVMKEAHQLLKKAHEILKQIHASLKTSGTETAELLESAPVA